MIRAPFFLISQANLSSVMSCCTRWDYGSMTLSLDNLCLSRASPRVSPRVCCSLFFSQLLTHLKSCFNIAGLSQLLLNILNRRLLDPKCCFDRSWTGCLLASVLPRIRAFLPWMITSLLDLEKMWIRVMAESRLWHFSAERRHTVTCRSWCYDCTNQG